MLAVTVVVTGINLGLPAHRIQKKLKSDSKSLEDNLDIPTQHFLALRQQREDCGHSTAKFLKYHLYSPFSPKFLKSLFSLSSPSHTPAHTIFLAHLCSLRVPLPASRVLSFPPREALSFPDATRPLCF